MAEDLSPRSRRLSSFQQLLVNYGLGEYATRFLNEGWDDVEDVTESVITQLIEKDWDRKKLNKALQRWTFQLNSISVFPFPQQTNINGLSLLHTPHPLCVIGTMDSLYCLTVKQGCQELSLRTVELAAFPANSRIVATHAFAYNDKVVIALATVRQDMVEFGGTFGQLMIYVTPLDDLIGRKGTRQTSPFYSLHRSSGWKVSRSSHPQPQTFPLSFAPLKLMHFEWEKEGQTEMPIALSGTDGKIHCYAHDSDLTYVEYTNTMILQHVLSELTTPFPYHSNMLSIDHFMTKEMRLVAVGGQDGLFCLYVSATEESKIHTSIPNNRTTNKRITKKGNFQEVELSIWLNGPISSVTIFTKRACRQKMNAHGCVASLKERAMEAEGATAKEDEDLYLYNVVVTESIGRAFLFEDVLHKGLNDCHSLYVDESISATGRGIARKGSAPKMPRQGSVVSLSSACNELQLPHVDESASGCDTQSPPGSPVPSPAHEERFPSRDSSPASSPKARSQHTRMSPVFPPKEPSSVSKKPRNLRRRSTPTLVGTSAGCIRQNQCSGNITSPHSCRGGLPSFHICSAFSSGITCCCVADADGSGLNHILVGTYCGALYVFELQPLDTAATTDPTQTENTHNELTDTAPSDKLEYCMVFHKQFSYPIMCIKYGDINNDGINEIVLTTLFDVSVLQAPHSRVRTKLEQRLKLVNDILSLEYEKAKLDQETPPAEFNNTTKDPPRGTLVIPPRQPRPWTQQPALGLGSTYPPPYGSYEDTRNYFGFDYFPASYDDAY